MCILSKESVRRLCSYFTVLCLVWLGTGSGQAAPSLDRAFGDGGVATVAFLDGRSALWQCHAVGVLPGGQIMVVGSGSYWSGQITSGETMILGRLQADGQPDLQFGSGGIKPIPLNWFSTPEGVTPEFMKVHQAAILSDGRILVAGSFVTAWNAPYLPWICRFTPDGELDPTFGDQGDLLLSPPSAPQTASAISSFVMHPSGSILLLIRGRSALAAELRRLNPSGQPDLTFGLSGIATINFGRPIESDRLLVEPEPAQGIVVALGYRERVNSIWEAGTTVMRWSLDGHRDLSYGDQGELAVLPGRDAYLLRGAAMPAGGQPTFLLSGTVVRLSTTGQLDSTFLGNEGGGVFGFDDVVGSRSSAGLLAYPDGRIAWGGAIGSIGTVKSFRVTRLLANGVADSTFTKSDQILSAVPGSFESRSIAEVDSFSASAMTLDAEGRLLLGGVFTRTVAAGQDEFEEPISEQRSGFLVGRISEEALPMLGFSRTSETLREGEGARVNGQRGVALTVLRTGSTNSAVTVRYRALSQPGNTAVANLDYAAAQGEIEFRAGQTSAQLFVPVFSDSRLEPSESFTVELLPPDAGANLEYGREATRVMILDGRADVSVKMRISDGSAWRQPGTTVEFEVEVKNLGPSEAGQLRVEIDVPPPLLHLPGMRLELSQGTASYDLTRLRFVWELGPLPSDTAARMTYQVWLPEVSEPMRILSEARLTVLSGPPDGRLENNSRSVTLVAGGADLFMGIRGIQSSFFEVDVQNLGPGESDGFVIKVWPDDNFATFKSTQAVVNGRTNWIASNGVWTRTIEDSLDALQTADLGARQFIAVLETNATSGMVYLELIPLGTGDQADPNPANNRVEKVWKPERSNTIPADPLAGVSDQWKACVLVNVQHYRGISVQASQGESSWHRSDLGGDRVRPSGLAAFYGLREVMKRAARGQELVNLYERHSPELSQILLQGLGDPEFLQDASSVLSAFESGYAQYLAGSGERERITLPMVDLLNRLLDRFIASGSQELVDAIETERARFNQLQDFVGLDFTEWGRLLELEVPDSAWLVVSSPRRLEDGTLEIEVNHAEDHMYSVWLSQNLEAPVWEQVHDARIEVVGHSVRVRIPDATRSTAFYRVRGVTNSGNR